MTSVSERYTIVFNGEIYNYRELRDELSPHYHWKGTSDTEVLLACFEHFGIDESLKRVVGMFAIGLWDSEAKSLTLIRDRIGEKPLYYGWNSGRLWFCSELKPVSSMLRSTVELNAEAIGLYLRFGVIPSPYSLYRGFFKLPPASSLTLYPRDAATVPSAHSPFSSTDAALCAPRPYWDPISPYEEGHRHPRTMPTEEAINELERLLDQSVSQQMLADVPVGAFLSGGIDSSCIAALMQQHSKHPVRTFSIGFQETGFDEAPHAKRIAAHLGTLHTELYVTPAEAQQRVFELPSVYDEPFADSSQIPVHFVCSLARRSVTVALSGDGGDEVFGGYNRYLYSPLLWNVMKAIPPSARFIALSLVERVAAVRWSHVIGPIGKRLPSRLRIPLLSDKLSKIVALLHSVSDQDVYRRLVSQWSPSEVAGPNGQGKEVFCVQDRFCSSLPLSSKMMLLDLLTYLPDDILVKLDRAAMSLSLETRAPFLDHRVVEFAARLPQTMKIRGFTSKYLLRKLLSRYVPSSLWNRPKMGFGAPIGEWLRGPLRQWAEELLSESSLNSRGLYRPEPIRRRWLMHLDRRGNFEHQLWIILMLQSWLAHHHRA